MLSANFKPKRTAAASRGFVATARLSCFNRVNRAISYFNRALKIDSSNFITFYYKFKQA